MTELAERPGQIEVLQQRIHDPPDLIVAIRPNVFKIIHLGEPSGVLRY
jgi:hypothetical protein